MAKSGARPAGPDAWEILAHLWQVMWSVLDESAPALEAVGLTSKAFFLLSAVEEHPFPAELARAMHLPPPTVTYLVKQMEAGGFLERRGEPGDLRKFRLVLTDPGRRAIASGRETLGAVFQARLTHLATREVESFEWVLARLSGPPRD